MDFTSTTLLLTFVMLGLTAWYQYRYHGYHQRWGPILEGNKHYLERQYDEALNLAVVAITRFPHSYHGYILASSSSIKLRDYERGLEFAEQACTLEPGKPEPLQNRALAKTYLNHLGSLEDANQAVLIKSTFSTLITRAFTRMANSRYDDALLDCNVAISKDAKSFMGYIVRSFVFMHLNRFNEAKADIEHALQLVPANQPQDLAVFLYAQSYLQASVGEMGRAIQTITEGIELDPQLAEAYINRAYYKSVLREVDEPLIDLEMAERIDKSPYLGSLILSNRARISVLRGDYSQALSIAVEAISKRVSPETICTRGICLLGKQDFEEAAKDFDQCIVMDPNLAEPYWFKAQLLKRDERNGEEAAALERKALDWGYIPYLVING